MSLIKQNNAEIIAFTGKNMYLRVNRKPRKIHEAGPLESREIEITGRPIRFRRHVFKKATAESNMLRLLTFAKSDKPELHLNFWQENLRSDYPVVVLRKSSLIDGGLGVVVTNNCVFFPSELMCIPNCNQAPQYLPAEKGTLMSLY